MIGEILLIIGCVAIVVGVITSRIIARKKGKSTCDCGCDCSACAACHRCAGKKDEADRQQTKSVPKSFE